MSRSENFISTRRSNSETDFQPQKIDFLDVILKSVAPDGGLYCPEYRIEPFTKSQLKRISDLSWVDLILRVQERLIDPRVITPQTLRQIIQKAYESFADPNNPVQSKKLSGTNYKFP